MNHKGDKFHGLTGFEQLASASLNGKIWLNCVPVVLQLLQGLQESSWKHWARCADNTIDNNEAYRREQIDVARVEKIFAGKDHRYAVMSWNTDERQLRQHIIQSYYLDFCGVPEQLAPRAEDAINGLLDSVAAGPRYAIASILLGECSRSVDWYQQTFIELHDDAVSHASFLLGMPKCLFVDILKEAQPISRNSPSGR